MTMPSSPSTPACGGYVPLDPIGTGGSATVWRARGADGVEVALKRLHAPLVDAVSRRRFARERELLERVGAHPAVAALLASGVGADGTGWYATALRVRDLDAALAAGALGPEARTVATLGLRLSAALAHAHARAVVHGDVKPANVLLDGAAHGADAALADFGAGLREGVTLTRVPGLSRGFAAPERLAGAPPSAASDLYGLGATLAAVARAGATADPLPPALAGLLRALLAESPGDRPASAADAFEAFATHVPAGEVEALPPVERAERVARETLPTSIVVAPGTPAAPIASGGAAAAPPGGARRRAALPFLAVGLVLGSVGAQRVATETAPAAAAFACAPGAYLCDGFERGWGSWERADDPALGTFRLVPGSVSGGGARGGTVLERVPGTAPGDGEGGASHAFARPAGGALRVRARIEVEPFADRAGSGRSWLELVHVQGPDGGVWAVGLDTGLGDGRALLGAYRYDPRGTHHRESAPGLPWALERPVCLEATLRPDGDGLVFEFHVDGRLGGRLAHPVPGTAPGAARSSGALERWRLVLGGPTVEAAATAPVVRFDEVRIDGGEIADACGAARSQGAVGA